MNNLNLVTASPFKLDNEPVVYTLSIHFNNLFAYFHPKNEAERNDMDKGTSALPHNIIEITRWLLYNEQYLDAYLDMRTVVPLSFRCAQLIKHYGTSEIANWLLLFYGNNEKEQFLEGTVSF